MQYSITAILAVTILMALACSQANMQMICTYPINRTDKGAHIYHKGHCSSSQIHLKVMFFKPYLYNLVHLNARMFVII